MPHAFRATYLGLASTIAELWQGRRERKARKKRRRARRPATLLLLERLEERLAPATYTWNNLAGGDWDTVSNWNVNGTTATQLPGSGDDVVIPVLNNGASVTHSTGSDTVNSVTSSANITLSGGTLQVNGNFQENSGAAVTVHGGTLANAVVTGGGTLVLTDYGGTLAGVTIAPGATVDGTQAPGGLVAFYNFDSGPNDVSGNGYNATLSSNPPTLTSAGYQGSAYHFNAANNNFLTAPINISPTAMPQLTMGGWFYASNANSVLRGLLSEDDGNFDRTIDIDTRNGGVRWSAFNGNGVVSGASVVANQWVFVAVRYNQTTRTMSLDVNGTMTSASTNFDSNFTTTLTVGRNPNFDTPFDGKIDNVFVYNQYLSDDQLNTLQQGTYATITGGLVVNGTVNLGSTNSSTYGQLLFPGNQTLSGNGIVTFSPSSGNALYAKGDNGSNPATLTIASGIRVQAAAGTIGGYYTNDAILFNGTLAASTPGKTTMLGSGGSGGTLTGFGSITASNGAILSIPESLQINDSSVVTLSSSSSLNIGGNLLGTTQNPVLFQPQGTITLNGAGTASAPELLEAMSADLGNSAAGFTNNFAYGTLILGSNTYVKLVNQSVNSPGGAAEAVYANSLSVPSGSTLDLGGLNLYVRDALIAGTITGGNITQLADGGNLSLNSPTPGSISPAGELDNWTFFERGGNSLTVALDPGSGAPGGPLAPTLQWAQVQLLDPSNHVLATANSTTANATLTLNNVMLPADGNYTIAVKAAPSHMSNTGNYMVSAWDVTAKIQSLNVNQTVTGTVANPYSTDQWTFSAAANTQVQFDLLAASASGLNFSLTGPSGFTGFTNVTGNSTLVTLPTSGTYTLTAQGTGGATGTVTFEMVQTTVTSLSLGTPFDGTLAGSGQPQLFTVNVPSPAPMLVQLTDAATADHLELYARFSTPPTRQTYDYGANGAGSSQSLLIPSAAAGTWYVLVYAESVAAAPRSFTLLVNASPLLVTAVTPVQYGTNAVARLTLTGAGFTPSTTVALVTADNSTVYPASTVTFDTFSQLTANVNLAGVPQGTYGIQVTNAGGSNTLPAAFIVTAAGQANLQTQLILPASVGRHESATFYVKYSNTGTVAMPAPLILLESSVADDVPLFTLNPALRVAGFWTSAIPQGYSTTVEILASGKVPGLLEPGESVTVPVYYAGMVQPWNFSESQFHFDLRIFTTADGGLANYVDWATLKSSLQPQGLSTSSWTPIYATLTSELVQLGPLSIPNPEIIIVGFPYNDYYAGLVGTWAGYVQLLDNEAAYLGQLGENVTDVSQLWGFAVQQADNALNPIGPDLASATDDSVAMPGSLSLSFSRVFSSSVASRYAMGPLGLGWSTPWQTTATTGSDGTVTISGAGGAQRVFQPDSRTAGAFFSQPGDTGTLKADGHGGYLLTEADGTATDYNPNGTLNFLQDTNGNKITAGYTSGKLTSLTTSSGQSITLTYNAAGLISTVTDSQGRIVTYTYDSSNQYLLAVTGFNGQTTSYTYNTTSGSAALNALTSIAFPGGTHQFLTYDTEGRLAGASNDGGAQPQTFTYNLGQVNITDGTGDTSSQYYNEQDLVVKSIDALNNVTLNTYDNNFNLVKVTNALGQFETYTYNTVGEVTSSTDFLGNTTHFVYSGPFNQLASMTDANGNKTNYAYSSAGNLLSTTYANGTLSSSTFDPQGDARSFLNQNGQPIQYTYNAAGQILTETFSDGSKYTYTYNGRGDMLTATDVTGTTTFTYDPTTELLTNVAYPNNLSLTFTYNAAGQRTSMVDQTGFTVNYSYDSVGRLAQLTDVNNNPIVTYTYDANGRLSKKVNGNGTYTTYQYDADGNILHLINYAPDGTVNSRFDYTYNALGLETTEATVDGTWTYTYDADGQLIHAVFASTNQNIPGQDLAYSYDAMGNRITTVINGVTTAYVTNSMNEYTSVGGVRYQYDADGNLLFDGTNTYNYNSLNQLVSVVAPSGTTTYTYNALGQRVSSTTDGQTTQYLIDPSGLGSVVSGYTGGGALMAEYTYGLGLTSQVTAAGSYFYDFDARGSTADLTNSSGRYIDQYKYLPFGEQVVTTNSLPNSFQFVGASGVQTEVIGQQFMRARIYDSQLGRFLTRDPLGLNGRQVDFYTYVANNPINRIDPTGLIWTWIAKQVGEKLLGKAIGEIPASTLFDYFDPISEIGLDPGEDGPIPPEGFSPPPNGLPNLPVYTPPPNDPPDYVGTPPARACWMPGDGPCTNYPEDYPGSTQGMMFQMPPEAGPPGFPFTGPGSEEDPATPPKPPGGNTGGSGATGSATSMDPNAMIGPAGYGTPNFVADAGAVFPYEIDFENDPTATAPAQAVTITDQLDPNLNWNTFQLTSIQWGDTILSIPAGSEQHYEATVPMTYNGLTFNVQVEAGIHTATGQVYATFQSIDPNTDLPPDVLIGFLPPEDGTGRGEGDVSYTVQPKATLATGTQIRNVALVTFDQNGAIATDQFSETDPSQGVDPTKQALVTIDAGAPKSNVSPLSATSPARFTVSWSGQDDTGGSGLATYSVYVSDNGGPYQPYVQNSTLTSADFFGLNGHTYAFYSVATDNVGNVQPTPSSPQTTTQVVAATEFLVTPSTTTASVGVPFTVTVTAVDDNNNPFPGYTGFVVLSSTDPQDTLLGTHLFVAGDNGTFTFTGSSVVQNTTGAQTLTAADGSISGNATLSVTGVGLYVNSFTPTPTGFTASFSEPFLNSSSNPIHIYDAASASYGAADVTLVGKTTGAVNGSLVINATNTGFTFVSAAGPLPPDTYTATFVSGAAGFADTGGSLLNGNGGTPGNYVTTFTVTSSTAVVVSVPSFARGPDSTDVINVPNNSANGIPITLSDGSGVTAGQFTLQYDSNLLSITGAFPNPALTGANFTLDPASTAGNAILDFSDSTPLTAGNVTLGGLTATVPANAPYQSKELLHFTSLSLNNGNITVTNDDAVHLVAFLADTSGDGNYTGQDATLLSRVAAHADSGFAAYPQLDPLIIGDINGDGIINNLDGIRLNLFLSGNNSLSLFPNYPGPPSVGPTGPDPSLSIPLHLLASAGGTVTVPVNIDDPRPAGSTGITQALLGVQFDPNVFTVSPADIHLGSVPASGTGWQLQTRVDDATGQLGIILFSAFPISSSDGGSLVTINFHVQPGATPGATSISLVAAVNPNGQGVVGTGVDDDHGPLTLHVAPTTDSPVGGQVVVLAAATGAAAEETVVLAGTATSSTRHSGKVAMDGSTETGNVAALVEPFPGQDPLETETLARGEDDSADLVMGAAAGVPVQVRSFSGTGMGAADLYADDNSCQAGVWVGRTDAGDATRGIILTSAGPPPLGSFFPEIDAGQAAQPPVEAALGPLVQQLDSVTLADLDSFFAFDPNFDGSVFVGGA